MTLVPPLADTEMSDCSIDSVLCFSSPLRPKQSLPAVTRTLRAVGHVTDSRCGRLPRGLTQCYLVAEVKGVEVMVVVFDELDVPASRKAERLRLDGSTGDVLLLGGPL
jgi:hypothetical protein